MLESSEAGPVRVAGVTRVEEQDMVRAYREVPMLRSDGLTRVLVMAVVAGACAIIAVRQGSLLWASGAGILAFLGASLAYSRRTTGRNAWRRMAEWERQVRYELTEHRLRIRTEKTWVELAYELLTDWRESTDAFYVQRDSVAYIIPKRAFENEEERDLVRATLQSRVVRRSAQGHQDKANLRAFVVWLAVVFGLLWALSWLSRG